MRLGILTSWPLTTTAGSGVVTSIRGFAFGLDAEGVDVRFVKPVRSRSSATATVLRRLSYNGRLSGVIRRQLRREALDALLGFDFDGCYLEPRWRPPLTVVCGGTLADIVRFETGWARRLLRFQAHLEEQNLQQADRVVVPSRYAAEAVLRHYAISADKLHVVRLATDVDGWQEIDAIPPGETPERPVVLSVARLYRRKSIHLLLQAWAEVRRRLSSGTLVLVGSGPEAPRLKRTARELGIQESVRFAGNQSDRRLLKGWYQSADLFCLPSRHETFGLVYLEAAIHGLATVALSTTAVAEVVADGRSGLLVPDGEDRDVEKHLAETLVQLLRDDELRLQLGKAARDSASLRNWNDAARELVPHLGPPMRKGASFERKRLR